MFNFKIQEMKKYLVLILLSVLFTGCSVKRPFMNMVYFTDYRPFLEKGFFISESDAVSFDYDAIGHTEIILTSGYEPTFGLSPNEKPKVGLLEKKVKGNYIHVTLEGAMNNFYEKAAAKGANGALKLHIEPITIESIKDGMPALEHIGYKMSGMLIKIR